MYLVIGTARSYCVENLMINMNRMISFIYFIS